MQGASVNGCAFCYDRNRDIFTFRIRGIQRGATQSNIHYLFLTYLTSPKGVSPDSSILSFRMRLRKDENTLRTDSQDYGVDEILHN